MFMRRRSRKELALTLDKRHRREEDRLRWLAFWICGHSAGPNPLSDFGAEASGGRAGGPSRQWSVPLSVPLSDLPSVVSIAHCTE